MPYIYKITNKINNKCYIGKTMETIEERFKQHIRDSKKISNQDRPLFRAFNKYGIENFSIEQIEKCNEKDLSDKEIYWIEYFGTFKYGYNATIGGDGKPYLDYDLIVATYKELKNERETARKLNINEQSVRKVLKIRNEKIHTLKEIAQIKLGHIINQYDLQGNFIKSFPSFASALKEIKGENYSHGGITHIKDVCEGKRKTAYGFIWKYAD